MDFNQLGTGGESPLLKHMRQYQLLWFFIILLMIVGQWFLLFVHPYISMAVGVIAVVLLYCWVIANR